MLPEGKPWDNPLGTYMITIGRVTNHNYDSWDGPPSNWGSRCCLIARGSMFNVVFPCVSLENHQSKGYIMYIAMEAMVHLVP